MESVSRLHQDSALAVSTATPRLSRSGSGACRGHPYEQGFDLRLVPEKLPEPLRWKTSRMVFVNSMSDLFHEDVPDDYVVAVAKVMELGELAHVSGADEARGTHARSALHQARGFAAEARTSGGVSASRTRSTACRASTIFDRRRHGRGSCPSSRCSKTLAIWISPESTGSSSAARAAPAHGRWMHVGQDRSATSARRPACAVLLQAVGRRAQEGPPGAMLDGRTYDDMPPITVEQVPSDAEYERRLAAAEKLSGTFRPKVLLRQRQAVPA